MLRPRLFSFLLLATLMCGSLAACGEDRVTPPFTVRVKFVSVVLPAVEQLRFQIQPQGTGERFTPRGRIAHEGGGITSWVSDDGQFIAEVTGDYVRDHAVVDPDDHFAYIFDFDMYASDQSASQEMIVDPVLRAFVVRRDVQIAENQPRFVEWPLVPGDTLRVEVGCISGYTRQCTNNDPPGT